MTAEEIGVSPAEAREVARFARDMRARYTIFDLAWDLGIFEEVLEDALHDSGVI